MGGGVLRRCIVRKRAGDGAHDVYNGYVGC
jgi:hypothetical protein